MKGFVMIPIVGVGLLIIAISVPMILNKIPPNPYYGFRVQKTMSNPEIWYKANNYCGWAMVVAGVLTVAAGVALAFIPKLSANAYMGICLAVMISSTMAATVLSLLYVRTL